MSKSYEIYSLPQQGNWVRYHIIAETAEGKQKGINDFMRDFMVYDASVEHETGTSAVVRRFYKQ